VPVVDALLLDLYDTLAWIRPELARREAIAERTGADRGALRAAWMETTAERSLGRGGSLEADIALVLGICGVQVEPDVLAELADAERRSWRAGVRLYDDVMPTLHQLRARGHRLALVSNCSSQTREVVSATGLDRALDAVVLSFEVHARKPDPRIFRAALRAIDTPPERALFVDDIGKYLDGAAALGVGTVQIVRDGVNRAASERHPRIRALTELVSLLDDARAGTTDRAGAAGQASAARQAGAAGQASSSGSAPS
jgi:putative hydrolase of the HAD superfamily